MAFEMAGWQTNPALVCRAESLLRTRWTTQHPQRRHERPTAELGIQLYRITRTTRSTSSSR